MAGNIIPDCTYFRIEDLAAAFLFIQALQTRRQVRRLADRLGDGIAEFRRMGGRKSKAS